MKFSSIVPDPPLFYPPMKNEFRGGWGGKGWKRGREESNNFVYNATSSSEGALIDFMLCLIVRLLSLMIYSE